MSIWKSFKEISRRVAGAFVTEEFKDDAAGLEGMAPFFDGSALDRILEYYFQCERAAFPFIFISRKEAYDMWVNAMSFVIDIHLQILRFGRPDIWIRSTRFCKSNRNAFKSSCSICISLQAEKRILQQLLLLSAKNDVFSVSESFDNRNLNDKTRLFAFNPADLKKA